MGKDLRTSDRITFRQASGILTKPSGFISAFDYSLNPYSGCAFGCTYCYAAFFARSEELQANWGEWVHVKENALELLKKKRKRPLDDATIYMSSVTDPYQPVERELELTRAILTELLTYHRVFPIVQTRAPLVTRDLDLLAAFENVQVNMTVTTDDETVRKAFEPACPPNQKRLDAVQQTREAGIDVAVTMTPLLPVRDPDAFADSLKDSGATRFVVQEFHTTRSRFVAGTGDRARAVAAEMGWDHARYEAVKAALRARLPNLHEGANGFLPYWLRTA